MRKALLSLSIAVAALIPGIASAAQPATVFQDLDATATEYFAAQGVLEGALDGSVHLAQDITRAEFVEAVVNYVYPEWAISERCLQELDTDAWPGVSYTLLFRDVSKDAPYALHLCAAMRGGMIWGYGDGNFRPNETINLAEASKVLSIAFNLGYQMPRYQSNDWYATYLKTLRRYTVFPATVTSPGHILTVGETRTLLESVNARAAAQHGSRVNGRMDSTQISTSSAQSITGHAPYLPPRLL